MDIDCPKCRIDKRCISYAKPLIRTLGLDSTYVPRCWLENHTKFCTGSRELLGFPTPRIHGYDFSYQGLLGIWDGFPSLTRNKSSVTPSVENPSPSVGTTIADSNSSSTFSLLGFSNLSRTHLQSTEDLSYGDFDVALDVLLSRQEGRASSLSLSLKTNKMKQRQCALQLCGWTLMDDSLSTVIKT